MWVSETSQAARDYQQREGWSEVEYRQRQINRYENLLAKAKEREVRRAKRQQTHPWVLFTYEQEKQRGVTNRWASRKAKAIRCKTEREVARKYLMLRVQGKCVDGEAGAWDGSHWNAVSLDALLKKHEQQEGEKV